MLAQSLNSAAHATASGLVFTGQGVIHSINVNTKAGIASAVTIFDNTAASGTILAIIDGTVNGSYILDAYVANGIYVSISAGSPDLTITYHRQEI